MRIVGGRLSGRRFAGPKTGGVRPTSERAREGLASALDARGKLEGARVLDLFAGTGALGFEALSRGAAHAVFVERDRVVCAALRRSVEELGLGTSTSLVAGDLLARAAKTLDRLVEMGPFDLVFADPPYAQIDALGPLLQAIVRRGLLAPSALVVVEHAAEDSLAVIEGLASVAEYRYGDTVAEFLTPRTQLPGETGKHR